MCLTVRERAESELVVRSFKHGQSNPTYYVKFGGRELVVRKKPVSCRTSNCHLQSIPHLL